MTSVEMASSNPSPREAPKVVAGMIKWFDGHKGYGFIARSEGQEAGTDILLHQTCVRESGFRHVLEGASVVCEVMRGPKGLQASRLLSLDNSTAHLMPSVAARSNIETMSAPL